MIGSARSTRRLCHFAADNEAKQSGIVDEAHCIIMLFKLVA